MRVGLFLKRGSTFASLRPGRIPHATTLRSPAEVDADVRSWLAESYASSADDC